MSFDANPMKTTTASISAGMQTWCDRIMLERQKAVLVHDQGAASKPIPPKSGKIHQMRRYTPLPVNISDLTLAEGVIPDGQAITEEQVLAYIYQYGGYAAKTDLVDLTHMDMETADLVDLLAQQGAELKDMVIREEMATTTTVQYANSKTAIYELKPTDKISVDEIRKMVRTLKQNKARPFIRNGRPHFMSIIGPEAEFDIMSDTKWINVATYQDKEKIYNGEIGKLYGVIFLYTTECKKYENKELIDGQLYLTAASITGATVTVDEPISEAEAAALVDRYVNIIDVSDTTGATHERHKIVAAAAGAAGAATVTLDAAPSGFTLADGDMLWANEYGYDGNTVYTTFVFGENAYSVGGIRGSEKIRSIIKPKDSGGVANPLNQFGTIGWKIEAMSVAVLQDLWLGQILHGASA